MFIRYYGQGAYAAYKEDGCKTKNFGEAKKIGVKMIEIIEIFFYSVCNAHISPSEAWQEICCGKICEKSMFQAKTASIHL